MKNAALGESLRSAGLLLAFAAAGTALLAYTFAGTRPLIQKTEEDAQRALMAQVLPRGGFDNDLLRDAVELPPSPLLGTHEPAHAYRARLRGRPVGVVLEAVAPDGYSGRIRLLIGILENGELGGVRVVAHKETPGLGDYIEITHSSWIRMFDHAALERPPAARWKVKKDGGDFDYMAGATISARAIVKAVNKALEYHAENRARLLGAPAAAPQGRT